MDMDRVGQMVFLRGSPVGFLAELGCSMALAMLRGTGRADGHEASVEPLRCYQNWPLLAEDSKNREKANAKKPKGKKKEKKRGDHGLPVWPRNRRKLRRISDQVHLAQSLSAMPWHRDLSKELLVRVLDFSSDSSVLELAAASRAVKTDAEECRPLSSEGSWRHPAGTWNTSGLWRFLGLGDLKNIPSVTLCCEVEFQNVAEAFAFLKAAKNLAADTIDDHVSFNQFLFSAADVNELFCGDGDDPHWCEADQKAAIKMKGCQIQCALVATRTCADENAPRTLFLDVDRTRRKNPRVICNSLLATDLRPEGQYLRAKVGHFCTPGVRVVLEGHNTGSSKLFQDPRPVGFPGLWLQCLRKTGPRYFFDVVGSRTSRRHIAMALLCNILAFLLASQAAGTCLPDGVAPERRKNLTKDGESFPVGVVLQPYRSAELAHAILDILISEVLGYNLRYDPHVPASSLEVIYAMIGCKTWYNRASPGCEERKQELHFVVESWHLLYPTTWEIIRQSYPAEIPLSADMGYVGGTGQFISASVVEAAETRGLVLEYYKMYQFARHQVMDVFDSIAVVNTSYFFQCRESRLNDNLTNFGYWKWTGDDSGVIVVNNSFKAFCPDGYFWRAPVCRNDPTQCILYVVYDWQIVDVMQRSAFFSIPLGVGVANSYENYLLVPKTYKSMFYYWTPEDSLLDLNPVKVIFPEHNAYAHSQGDLTTASSQTPLAKLTSHDLGYLAPDLFKLLENSAFDMDTIYDLMRERQATEEQPREIACRWLKNHGARWLEWIPDPTLCIRGFGLYDATTESFSPSRASASTCKACLPGTYSKLFKDDWGITHVCEECSAGSQQPAAGEVSCNPCPAGTFKEVASTEDCAPCPAGYYQNEVGAQTCKKCPNGTTTILLRATLFSDCVCIAGSIDVSGPGNEVQCVTCGEGLSCADGSTLEGLKLGHQKGPNGLKSAEVMPGYFSWSSTPTEVFKCLGTHCPGGLPGTCEGGRLGPTCHDCASGMYWADGECRTCEVSKVAAWIACPFVLLLVMITAYYVTEDRYKARAALRECATIGGDMLMAFLQNLGILSVVSVPLPETLKMLFEWSSLFVLNLRSLGLSCASSDGMQQYLMSSMFFLIVVMTFPLLGYVTQFCSCMRNRGWNWGFYKTVCVTGKFLQSCFTLMCNIGLVPFMCFRHPNGRHSILKYPNTFCGSAEHGTMQLFGVLVLVLSFTHFILCCWASWKAPTWSLLSPERIRGIGFFIGNFRPSTWWFGLILLARGPLLSLPVVLSPNVPGIQLALMLCVLIVSFTWQLWFLPWKAPVLNLVDAISTALFLILLAISLHLESAVEDSLSFLDSFGAGVYFLSLGIIGCVCILALVLVVWQRCTKRKKLMPSIINLGPVREPEEILEILQVIVASLEFQDGSEKEALLRKMSHSVSTYDLCLVGEALDILIADCELGILDLDRKMVGRVAAKRLSQMNKKSLASLHATPRTARIARIAIATEPVDLGSGTEVVDDQHSTPSNSPRESCGGTDDESCECAF
eukprot:s396_g18.t3